MIVFDWLDAVTAPDRVVWRRYKKARELLLQGNYPEALTLFDSAVRMNPTDPYLFLGRGIAHYRTGGYEAAIADFSTVIRLGFSDLATAYFNRAAAYGNGGDYDASIADFSKALELDFHDAGLIHFYRARIYGYVGNLDAAIEDYADALRIGLERDKALEALEYRGNMLLVKEEWKRAESNFQELFRLDGESNFHAHIGIGYIRFALKDYTEAIQHFTQAIIVNEDSDYAYYHRGNAYLEQWNWNAALQDYEEAIRLNPRLPHAHNNRGVACIHLNEWPAAQSDFEQALAIDDKFPYAYAGIGDLYFLRGEYELALEAFNKARELGSDIKGITASLAVTHHALNQVERAVEIWRGLVEQNSNYRDADWVKDEHMWRDELVEEARKLITRL